MLTWTNAATNIVMDGHSMMQNGGVQTNADRMGDQLMRMSTISNAMTYTNIAVNGQSLDSMIANMADLHAAYVPGRENLLFILEAGNTAQGVPTGMHIIALLKTYIKNAKAVHPWRVFFVISPPCKEGGVVAIGTNAKVDVANQYVRDNGKRIGIEGWIETRAPGTPLYVPPDKYQGDWNLFVGSGLYQDDTHPNAAGLGVIAANVNTFLPTIANVAPRFPKGGGLLLGGM